MRGLRLALDGSLEVVVEARSGREAGEQAARLTDGEADAPSLPSRRFV